jgi:hypothetical protein
MANLELAGRDLLENFTGVCHVLLVAGIRLACPALETAHPTAVSRQKQKEITDTSLAISINFKYSFTDHHAVLVKFVPPPLKEKHGQL